ncbi:hypothetical protein [Saccharopolyspora taberi]|uniref:Uncharacterized protein n=1 Tax=Saccharopolyspora taberi TaxID=60895 RepID=A0ABN3V0G7_9PSEU
MTALSVLRCDHEGCDRTYIKAGSNPYLKQAAEVEGWWCGEDFDWCPQHIPAVEHEDEAEVRNAA